MSAGVASSNLGVTEPAFVAHLDAVPPGVVLGTEPTTAELREVVAADEYRVVAGDAPAGDPGLPNLTHHVMPSCTGTGSDGNRIQAIYAIEKGQTDRYTKLAPLLRSWIADVDDTFAASTSSTGLPRRVRWVNVPVDGTCRPVVKRVTLPAGSLDTFQATVKALKATGLTSPARKYLVFADTAKLCGVGGMYVDSDKVDNANDGTYPTYARVDSPCWAFKSGWHSVAAHEVMHMLGGVQDGAPNSTGAGHCVDETDVMCYNDGGDLISKLLSICAGKEALFDCRRDDYYSTATSLGSYLKTHWNAADSSFLDKVGPLAPAPAVSIQGPANRLQGTAVAYRAVTSATNVSYRWSSSPTACVPGTRTAAAVNVICPASYTGSVTLWLTATPYGAATAKRSKVIGAPLS